MPGIAITDTEMTGLLKRVYHSSENNIFPVIVLLWAQLEKMKRGGSNRIRWGGEGVFANIRAGRPVGFVPSPTGRLPASHKVREHQLEFGVRRFYIRRIIDNLTNVATASKAAAFMSIGTRIREEMRDALRLGMQEQVHGDGRGVKAAVGTVTSTTQLDLISPFGIANGGEAGLRVAVGMTLSVMDSTLATERGKLTVATMVPTGDTATITWVGAIAGMVAGDLIVSSTDVDNAANYAFDGVVNITNRGNAYPTLHALSNVTEPLWDATRMVAGTDTDLATKMTEIDIWRLLAKIKGKSGLDPREHPKDYLLFTTPGLEQKIAETFLGERRFDASNQVTLKGGYKGINISGLTLASDFDVPAGTVYAIHLPSLLKIDGKEWGGVQFEGAGPWRWVDGYDAFETSWSMYGNMGTLKRSAHGSITGYTDTQRFSYLAA